MEDESLQKKKTSTIAKIQNIFYIGYRVTNFFMDKK